MIGHTVGNVDCYHNPTYDKLMGTWLSVEHGMT